MNKEQFIEQYCKGSKITEEYYNENFVALLCCCGEPICNGWATVRNSEISIKNHLLFSRCNGAEA